MPASSPAAPSPRGRMALTVTGLFVLLSATGAATPKAVAKLQALGLGVTEAHVLLHVAPVVLGALATVAAQMIAAGRSVPVRFGVYGGLGILTGFVLGYCLDLFVGAGMALEAAFGPSKMGDEHLIGWSVTILTLIWAVMLGAVAVFGTPAARALQEPDGDPDCAEVRPRDRAISREAALSMAALGVSTGALTILDQMAPAGPAAALLAAVSVLGFLGSTIASWSIWRRSDELQQRAVLQAYAACALAVTLGVFAWAVATSLGAQITLSPYALYIAFTLVQFVAGIAANIATQAVMSAPRGRAA